MLRAPLRFQLNFLTLSELSVASQTDGFCQLPRAHDHGEFVQDHCPGRYVHGCHEVPSQSRTPFHLWNQNRFSFKLSEAFVPLS